MTSNRLLAWLGALVLLAGVSTVLVVHQRQLQQTRSRLQALEERVDRGAPESAVPREPAGDARNLEPHSADADAPLASPHPPPNAVRGGSTDPVETGTRAATGVPAPGTPPAGAAPLIAGAGPIRLVSKPGSRVVITGTSSIHDWTVESAIIRGWLEVRPDFLTRFAPGGMAVTDTNALVARAELSVPVRSLKSGKQKMDEIMREAMRAAEHPEVTFRLEALTPLAERAMPDARARFVIRGPLSVSGVEVACELEATLDASEGGKWVFEGQERLKMTDFRITPPAPTLPGLDAITTGDEIGIDFHWVVAPASSENP